MTILLRRIGRVLPAALLAGIPARLPAQAFAPKDSVTITPGAQFKAGGLHRLFFGTRYRDLWATPIRVPVLDLARFAGGLKPIQRGGGQQTRSLRFAAADGRQFAFRSVSKDPTATLPAELRETFAANVLRDQMSSGHPMGPLVVAPLLDAAGVLHATPILAVMPDDPALGEFRKDFAGMLGMIEERPKELADEGASFAGAQEIVGTDVLYERLDKEPSVRVDARAFLLARLTDVFLGDWDRHADQWRWALVGGEGSAGDQRWLPIPRDRDQAFVRFDGFLLSQARRGMPQLLNFGPGYGDITGATWNGRNLDRRFLTGLERPVWDSTVRLLKGRLTDQAIAKAVEHLPPELRHLEAARLEAALRARRDHLDQMAGKYYRLLAHEVDVYGTDKPDDARVVRRSDGSTEVTLSHKGQTYYHRVFRPGETREVRLYLQGGADHLIVEGDGKSSPTIRAIGGGGDDQYDITSRAGGVKLYDDRGDNHAAGAGINTRRWRWKPDSLHPKELPPRDWGRKTVLLLSANYGPDVQAVLGYGGHTDWYGFRRVPYATKVDYKLVYSVGENAFRGNLGVTREFENSHGFVSVDAMGSGMETLRWYGFGNETVQGPEGASFYRVHQNQVVGGVNLGFRFGKRNHFTVGPVVRWSDTDIHDSQNSTRFIAANPPYGVGSFGMAGVRAGLRIEGRDHPAMASRGAALSIEAASYPGIWDNQKPVERVEGKGSVVFSPGGSWRPSLNLSAGAVKTWGPLPFFLAPTLGGSQTLRGYRPDRFAGDAAVYGSAEIRLPLTRIKFIVPGEQGVFGFGDAGRVYLRGESSDQWHSSAGGGLWFSFLNRDNVILVGAAKPTKDKEGTRFLLGFGFPY